jgi:hypothetical protein
MRFLPTATLLLAALAVAACSKGGAPVKETAVSDAKPRLDIRYFHRTIRCPSCTRIEQLARQAVEQTFAGELSSGRVTWAAVNLDAPENAHYDKDYKLTAQSVVLSEVRGGTETRWKNLEKVWDLLSDEAAFTVYVQEEVLAWLNDSQAKSPLPGESK